MSGRIRKFLQIAVRPYRYALDFLDLRILGPRSRPGSRAWLTYVEAKFGGYFHDPSVAALSAHDDRFGVDGHAGHEGGDRMARCHHGYASGYAKALKDIDPKVIVEVGVLRGSGLATWSLLFPKAQILALDIDFAAFKHHEDSLVRSGAFASGGPILLQFDAFRPDVSDLSRVLSGRKIDLVIDDGPHDCRAVLATAKALGPFLASDCVYIIEDALECRDVARGALPGSEMFVSSRGLVVAKPKSLLL